MEIDEIEEGYFYHIYNRGNNSEKIFFSEENYAYFLKLLTKYIFPVADIYAYCLLNNHFHILVRIKEKNEIEINKLKFSTVEKPKEVSASRQFSHFLNAYSQAVNKKYARTGSLFEKRFERKRISDDHYLRQVILYINTNPLKHNLVENPKDYKWSSYHFHFNRKSPLKKYIQVDTNLMDKYFKTYKKLDSAIFERKIKNVEIDEYKHKQFDRLSNSDLCNLILKLTNGKSIYSLTKSELEELIIKLNVETNASMFQIASLTHENYDFVKKICKDFCRGEIR